MTEQTYEQQRWSLDDLYSGFDDPALGEAYAEIERRVAAFEGVRDELTDELTEARFVELLDDQAALTELFHRVYSFAGLAFAADTADQRAATEQARAQQAMAEAGNKTMFFSLWWKGVDDAVAERLLAASGDYAYWLQQIRNSKPFTLSEAEEKVINIKNVTGASALATLYDTITSDYTFTLEVDGEAKQLTRGELMSYARDADPALRAAAYQELYRVYGDASPVLGHLYSTIVRDWRNENVQLRGFASPIAARNLGNDLPDAVIDTLLEVTRRNVGLFQRVFKLKARVLGVDKLRRYDLYAPVSDSAREYSFDEAVDLTLEAYTRFDERFATQARRVLADDHLDSEVRKGKRGGAFCWTVTPDLSPWVLVNFQGRIDDVSTVAHELGHAVHSMLAEDHTIFTNHACLPLAETASTFGEMTLADLLLEREPDAAVRRDILFRELDDAYATIIRQVYFALFERDAHEKIAAGASTDELNAAYLENLREQFGDALEVTEEFQHEWVSIPHIYHTPFYVYAYAFGQLLVYALYKRYGEEGRDFVPKYLRLLSAGGSVAPIDLLAEVGFDVTTEEFWQGGFDVIAGRLDELEKLCKE